MEKNTQRLALDLPEEVHTDLKLRAVVEQQTMAALVRRLIEDYLYPSKKKPAPLPQTVAARQVRQTKTDEILKNMKGKG